MFSTQASLKELREFRTERLRKSGAETICGRRETYVPRCSC